MRAASLCDAAFMNLVVPRSGAEWRPRREVSVGAAEGCRERGEQYTLLHCMATLLPLGLDAAAAAPIAPRESSDVVVSLPPLEAPAAGLVPSESQRAAIEAGAHPLLVLACPGAGKTFCLIERIRYLIEHLGFAPERLCAFTFTNKAAGEIAERLERTVGARAAQVRTGTIHAFCAELLREFGSRVGLEPGFGIADDRYQRAVLRRLGQHPRFHGKLLSRFGTFRFRGEPFQHSGDALLFEKYEHFLEARRIVDFDMLVLKTAELLKDANVVRRIRSRWDCILVDEFQDLNPVQYAVVRDIGLEHGHVFAVGDEEQSIYSWAGADPRVFRHFLNDFRLSGKISLRENRRCPHEILTLARRLVEINEPLFGDKKDISSERMAGSCVHAVTFPNDGVELSWVVRDILDQREKHGLAWGDFALLYRKHEIGDAAEATLLGKNVPCRLAQGRALGEDPVVAYVVAALRVIAAPDDITQENFLEVVLPAPLVDDARAKAEHAKRSLLEQFETMRRDLPRDHGDAKKIKRGFFALANLTALGRKHGALGTLVEELLSQRIGEYRTVLEEHHDELTDPAGDSAVVRLAERLSVALEKGRPLSIPRLGGGEIALQGMLSGLGMHATLGDEAEGSERITPADAGILGLPLTLFKAAQLVRSRHFRNEFRDFVAIDIESTDKYKESAEPVEIAMVRVRGGVIVDELHSMVRPRAPISVGAIKTHGITEMAVADAPRFEDVWPRFREFAGDDVLVAHNGQEFDFPILRRMSADALCTYDTLPLARDLHSGSAKLVDLARHFGVDPGASHRALDDARTLARVFPALNEHKVVRARKTSLVHLLDWLGVALALCDDDDLDQEGVLLRRLARPFALGRYSDCLELYRLERERAGDNTLPTVAQLIERLGGEQSMQRLRAERGADDRYPQAMARLRRLLEQCARETLADQIGALLERIALSKSDGAQPEHERVNLLTLHSTKGLEFSRVYILGVEDAQLPGVSPSKQATKLEIEEARRLLYVGMTRTKDRLILTHVGARNGHPTGGHRFLDEMGMVPKVRKGL